MRYEAEDRTEAATPRRRREARERGQVARSQDLPAALILFAGLWMIELLGPRLWQFLLSVVRTGLYAEGPPSWRATWSPAAAAVAESARQLAPLMLVLMSVVLAVLFAQVGPLFTWKPVMPNFSKINPLLGLQRLFSARSVMLSVINLGKVLVVALVAGLTLRESAPAILYALTLDLTDGIALGSSIILSLGLRLAGALVVLALLDYGWQRYRHEKDLRMTKEEVKDELRSMEGDPKLKARRRQVQYQLAIQRLRKEVPRADVVVTNPTHFAVALAYDARTMAAPKVVAKGADYLALRIREIAAEAGVPIVERKPLARALYESVDVGQFVPERFYRAVAEILAYIYELTGRSAGQGRAAVLGA